LAAGRVARAGGATVATARADLIAQGLLAVGMWTAFLAIHRKHRGQHWVIRGRRRPHDISRTTPEVVE
jgi:hypothetical protein